MAHDLIDFNMIKNIGYLTYYQYHTGIGERMIDNIAKHQSNVCFGQSHDLY